MNLKDYRVNPICRHERTEVRYKTFANDMKHLCNQCMICGQTPEGARWLSQEGIDMGRVKPFDETIAPRWKAIQAKLQKEKLERHIEMNGMSIKWYTMIIVWVCVAVVLAGLVYLYKW